MLSLARSRYTLPSQLVFLITNSLGVLLSTIYNANTPDLYPNNAHHKLGWIVTVVVGAQFAIGLLSRLANGFNAPRLEGNTDECASFIPVSAQAMVEHESRFPKPYRLSRDSGHGTERRSESLYRQSSRSISSNLASPTMSGFPLHDVHKEEAENYDHVDLEARPAMGRHRAASSFVEKAAGKLSTRALKPLIFAYNFVDRTIIVLGFVVLCTGIATYSRLFVSSQDCRLQRV